jgi:hypothetical protein
MRWIEVRIQPLREIFLKIPALDWFDHPVEPARCTRLKYTKGLFWFA